MAPVPAHRREDRLRGPAGAGRHRQRYGGEGAAASLTEEAVAPRAIPAVAS
jgi:hypothetical protein